MSLSSNRLNKEANDYEEDEQLDDDHLDQTEENIHESDSSDETNDDSIYSSFPTEIIFWKRLLYNTYQSIKQDQSKANDLEQSLDIFFGNSEDLANELLLVFKSFRRRKRKLRVVRGFFGIILTNLNKWLNEDTSRLEYFRKKLTFATKMMAFKEGAETSLLKLLDEIFHLNDYNLLPDIIKKIKEMLNNGRFFDAAYCCIYFGVRSYFSAKELALPLLFLSRDDLLETLLDNEVHLQNDFLKALDDFVGLEETQIRRMMRTYCQNRKAKVPVVRFKGKALEKLILKYLKKFDLNASEVAPKYLEVRERKEINYLIFKRFMENTLTEESFFDYIRYLLLKKDKLIDYFLNYLFDRDLMDEAFFWTVYFNSECKSSKFIRSYITKSDIISARARITKLMPSDDHYDDLYLFGQHKIKIIANQADLRDLMINICSASIVGIDSEFRPHLVSNEPKVAIFQISFDNESYIVDVLALENLSEETWKEFFSLLFTRDLLKLGFAFHSDWVTFCNTFSFLKSMESEVKNMICLSKLATSLIKENRAIIDNEKTNAKEAFKKDETIHCSLADLSKWFLNTTLDKSEQIGNWATRPLRPQQLRYAAMDSYCLLNIYNVLMERAVNKFKMDWTVQLKKGDLFQRTETVKSKAKEVDKKEFMKLVERVNNSVNVPQQNIGNVKFIVDMMIAGIGKHLRMLGADTILVQNRRHLLDCAKEDPDRIVLSFGKSFRELEEYGFLRNSGRLFHVSSDNDVIVKLENLLTSLKIQLNKEDIFSRCSKCNAKLWIRIPPHVLLLINKVLDSPETRLYEYFIIIKKIAAISSEYNFEFIQDPDDKSNILVFCEKSSINIRKCTVFVHEVNKDIPLEVPRINESFLKQDDLCFRICGSCGKVYWDGAQLISYKKYASSLMKQI